MNDFIAESRLVSLRNGYLALDEHVNNHDYLSRVLKFIVETRNDSLAWKWVMISLHAAIYGLAVRRCAGTSFFRVLRPRKNQPLVGTEPLIGFDEALQRCQAASSGSARIVLTVEQQASIRHLKLIRNGFMHFMPSCTSHHIDSLRRSTQDGLDVVDMLAGNNPDLRKLTEACRTVLSSAPAVQSDINLPSCICAADWSVNAKKRRAAVAYLVNGRYRIERIISIPDPRQMLSDLKKFGDSSTILIGFDFPIGLPAAYARRRGHKNWREFLAALSTKGSAGFFIVTDSPSLEQPFYPRTCTREGQRRVQTLVDALGMKSRDDLYRQCEQPTTTRGRAASLFFTLGGQQVGRAALHGWQNFLVSNRDEVAMWPFDGGLGDLLAEDRPVVAEIYPAEYYRLAGIPPAGAKKWSKRRRENRKSCAAGIVATLQDLGVSCATEIEKSIRSGFDSEDAFDAVLGMIGMLSVVMGGLSADPPPHLADIKIEGWILGMGATKS